MLSLTFFTAHTSLGCRKCLIGMLFDHKPDTLLPRTLYRTRVAAHDILKVQEEDAMNDALFATLSNYRERTSKLTGISNKTLDRASKLSRRSWSSHLVSHEATGRTLVTLTSVKYV